MKKNKTTFILFILLLSIVLIVKGFNFLISGEELGDKASWLTEMPIAHRGLDNGDIPENSISSFEEAIKHNYAIEIDIQLTKDKVPVIFHDDDLKRITGDERYVRDVNYKELKDLKIEGTDETIPSLQETLDFVDGRVPLLIEIKDGQNAKEIALKTYEVVKSYEGEFAIQSFNPFILEWFKENAGDKVVRCQLASNFKGDKGKNLKGYEKFVLKNLLLNFKSRPHVLAYDLHSEENLSIKIFKSKNPMISWTIKSNEDRDLALAKTDNIIFDNILP